VVNLVLTRGDAWAIEIDFAMDLTGFTFAAQIRRIPDADTKTDLSISETDLVSGVIQVGQDQAGDEGYWDLQLTTPGGLPRTYIGGYVEVREDVTRV
jgi:hypothetical protein